MTSTTKLETQASRPIILLFTGHVGSSWLTDLIGRHPQINHVGFEPVDAFTNRSIDADRWIERLACGESPSAFPPKIAKILTSQFLAGAPYFIFKTRARTQRQQKLFFELIPKLNSYVILLRRRNKLKTAISSYKRNELKISHLDKPELNANKRHAVRVDPSRILTIACDFIRREIRLKNLFEKYRTTFKLDGIEVIYEDILQPAGIEKLKATLCTDLAITPFISESKFTKMTEDDLRIAVTNYDELAQFISGTIIEKFLVDDEYDPVQENFSDEFTAN